jgi:predicted acylesterase/phospholipase RssA
MSELPITGVFEGGGVRGVALAGAAAAALDHGFRFARAVGTSAGALVGSLVAAGCVVGCVAQPARSGTRRQDPSHWKAPCSRP